ncbi:hypothetical protein [Nocardia aobensis]|uniref:hypothetical protein n=1 Tax=Nocardia aobensis TaxID=257277 RepID=UPI0002D3F2AE|nr:hypothetical protein [Nocardia aobensis]
MATLDDAFNNDDKFIQRSLTRAAHFMLWAIGIAVLMQIPFYLGYDWWITGLVQSAMWVFVLIGILHNNTTRLCVRCMQEVPDNAGERAEQRKPVLWLNHRMQNLRGILILSAAAVFSYGRFRLGWPRLLNLSVDALSLCYLYSIWLHHRLRPWCPYCRDWGDDGDIHEPSPDPIEKATR